MRLRRDSNLFHDLEIKYVPSVSRCKSIKKILEGSYFCNEPMSRKKRKNYVILLLFKYSIDLFLFVRSQLMHPMSDSPQLVIEKFSRNTNLFLAWVKTLCFVARLEQVNIRSKQSWVSKIVITYTCTMHQVHKSTVLKFWQ